MALENYPVANAALIQFLAEVGDRSFFVLLLLSSWCPLAGIRAGSRWLEVLLVSLGALAALVVRLAIESASNAALGTSWRTGAGMVVAPVVLWGLAVKAYFDYQQADAVMRPWSTSSQQSEWKQDPAFSDVQWADVSILPGPGPGNAAEESCAAEASSSYGTMVPPSGPEASTGPTQKAEADESTSALQFVIPFICILAVATTDPIRGRASDATPHSALGAGTGAMLALLLAVFLGFVLEREVSDRRFLLVTATGFAALALAATSQALLHFLVVPPAKPQMPF